MKKTKYLNLNTLEYSDSVDIEFLNFNTEIVDQKIKDIDNAIKNNKKIIDNKEFTWKSLKGKPVKFEPEVHKHKEYANKNEVPKQISQLINDSGYIKETKWTQIKNKPSTFNPSSHNHSNYVNKAGESMTGTLTVPKLIANEVYVGGEKQPKVLVSKVQPKSPVKNDIWIDIS